MISNSNKTGFKILVDADACPVKGIISQLGKEFGIPVIFIASIAHNTEKIYDNAEFIWVDNSPQAVDTAIVNRTDPGDLVVTADYGLASLVLSGGGQVISPRGHIYNSSNIDTLLAQRHVYAKIRRSGGKTKGPGPLLGRDKIKFAQKLRELLMLLTSNKNLY